MAMSVVYTNFGGEIVSENRGGVEREYMPDTQGNTVALLDSSQTKTDTWTYWPYGEVKTRTGTNPTPFTYVGTRGYYADTSTRTYVRARNLRVDHGSWMTVDPLWPFLRAFRYCRSSPTALRDPSGLIVQGVVGFVKVGRGAAPTRTCLPRTALRPLPVKPIGRITCGQGTIFVMGAIALVDLCRWAWTGEEGPFTGVGGAIGRRMFPAIDELPGEGRPGPYEVPPYEWPWPDLPRTFPPVPDPPPWLPRPCGVICNEACTEWSEPHYTLCFEDCHNACVNTPSWMPFEWFWMR